MLKSFLSKNILAKNRVLEEQLYAQVAKEMASGYMRDGLWAKAFSKSEGSEGVARSIYIKLRVQSLLDEIKLKKEAVDTLVASRAAQQKIHEEKITQEIIVPQVVKKQTIEKTNEPCNLSKLKSSIMRDEVDYVRRVSIGHENKEFKQHLLELLELADLFDANESKDFLSCYQKENSL